MTAGDVKSALLIEEHKRANPALLHAPPQLSMFETLWPSYDREALSFSILAVLCSVTSSLTFYPSPSLVILIYICLVILSLLLCLISYLSSFPFISSAVCAHLSVCALPGFARAGLSIWLRL